MGLLGRFVEQNRRVCRWERGVAARFTFDGMRGGKDYSQRVLPSLLRPGLRVLDVGGGKRPAIELDVKRRLELTITGLDISEQELRLAPTQAYDDWVVGDVATVTIPGVYDLILSRTLIEHLPETRAAFQNMASALAKNGTMAHLIPCRNAPFAVANRILGNRLGRALLFTLFPARAERSGFQAYYRECTPSKISALCNASGLRVTDLVPYYRSEYASFFVPLYTVELLRQFVANRLGWKEFCEVFTIVARDERER